MARVRADSDHQAGSYARKVQGYLPSKEMREAFASDAEEFGGMSNFITQLYKRHKRGELKLEAKEKKVTA